MPLTLPLIKDIADNHHIKRFIEGNGLFICPSRDTWEERSYVRDIFPIQVLRSKVEEENCYGLPLIE